MRRRLGAWVAALVVTAATFAGLAWFQALPAGRAPVPAARPIALAPRPPVLPPPPEPAAALVRHAAPRLRPPPPRPVPPRRPAPLSLRAPVWAADALAALAVAELAGAGDGGSLFEEREVEIAPQRLSCPQPPYPLRWQHRGVEGVVEAFLVVGRDGRVEDVTLGAREPPGAFDDAVLATLRAWRFEPARQAGRTVRCRCRVVVRFTLDR